MEYEAHEFLKILEESYKYCKEVDDCGSVDRCAAKLWHYFHSIPQIDDEFGGI